MKNLTLAQLVKYNIPTAPYTSDGAERMSFGHGLYEHN